MSPEDRYDSLFRFYALKHAIDWRLLKAQVKAESAFDPHARSRVGAVGLAQFMANTWREWCDGLPGIESDNVELPNLAALDPRDPEAAIAAQAAYMAWLLRRSNMDIDKALAAYNWGIGRVSRAGDSWRDRMPDETRAYIKRIRKFYGDYTTEV